MKGRELSQAFFASMGEPAIAAGCPEVLDRLAVGVMGGSQAHGNDDEVSRDHGWGPAFGIWLTGGDFRQYGTRLQEILAQLPHEFRGFGWPSGVPKQPCAALDLDEYLKSLTGFAYPPESAVDWLRIPEEYLFEVTPKRLFLDRLGRVTERFGQFCYYPDDVWYKRLSYWVSWTAEWGEKHLFRAWKRGEYLTAAIFRAQFATAVMRVGFLLNRRYSPYEKWVHREFLKLPRLRHDLDPLLRTLIDGGEPFDPVKQVVDLIVAELEHLGVVPISTEGVIFYPSVLRDYARGLRKSIADERIAAMSVHIEAVLPTTKAAWIRVMPD